MKAKLLIAFLCLWCALPHRQASAAELHFLEAPCASCGGNMKYSTGDSEAECESCGTKLALILLMIGGCLAILSGGCYVAHKLKKAGGTNGVFNSRRRFGTNLDSALRGTNAFSIVRSDEPSDLPWLLSLATAPDSSGRYVLESSTNAIDWFELGRYADDSFLAVHPANESQAFYRLRVNP